MRHNSAKDIGSTTLLTVEQLAEEDNDALCVTELEDMVLAATEDMEEIERGPTSTPAECAQIDAQLARLHQNLGHPSNRTLFKVLKHSGAAVQVLQRVMAFRCHGCQAAVAPKAVRVAAGIEVPGVLEVMGTDGLEWLHPRDFSKHIMTLNEDEGSTLTQVTYHGKVGERPSNRTADEVIRTWDEWCAYYRRPRLLRMDPEGCHDTTARHWSSGFWRPSHSA